MNATVGGCIPRSITDQARLRFPVTNVDGERSLGFALANVGPMRKGTTLTRTTPASDARERILNTSYRLFCSHGVRAVGIDTIIEESGVAKMSIYRHFRS